MYQNSYLQPNISRVEHEPHLIFFFLSFFPFLSFTDKPLPQLPSASPTPTTSAGSTDPGPKGKSPSSLDSRRRRVEPSFQVTRQNTVQNVASTTFIWKVKAPRRLNPLPPPTPVIPSPAETQFLQPPRDPTAPSSFPAYHLELAKTVKPPHVKIEHRAPILQNTVDWTPAHTTNSIAFPPVPACHAESVTPATNGIPYIKRHATRFLFDGNVLLQLENVRFKLHESRLTLTSPLFACLFKDTRRLLGSSDWVRERQEWKGLSWSEDEDGYILCLLDGTGVLLSDFEVLLDIMDNSL